MNSNNFWKNKNVIVTGHTGFKGSWLVNLLKYLDSNIVGISREKYEGVELVDVNNKEGVKIDV